MTSTVTTLHRRPDWPACLAAWLARSRRMAFAWGLRDCCLWSASGVCAITDVDLAAPLRRTYDSYTGALAALRETYGTTDVWAVPEAHGLVEIPVAKAQRGDLVGATMQGRHSLGQCGGGRSAFLGRHGLVWVQTLNCKRAWRVG